MKATSRGKLSVSIHRISDKNLKENETKLPRLNKSVHKSKSMMKRGTTVEKKSFLADIDKNA